MSEEIRGLLHATARQGRTELVTPPRVPAELDRTFAYAKHTWASGVGAPPPDHRGHLRRDVGEGADDALFAPSH
jgi:hypothetical protein